MRAKNPQMFQFLEQAQKNQSNPTELLKQVTNKYTPEQMTNLFNKAKQFGITDEQINEIKNSLK